MDDTFLNKLINTYEKNLVPYFRGVLNMEEFLNESGTKINRNADNIFVFNTESQKDYGHWIAFLTVSPDRGGNAYFIDSFARPPEVYDSELKNVLTTLSPNGNYSSLPYPVQSEQSKSCGLWVLYFLIQFGKNPSHFSINSAIKMHDFKEEKKSSPNSSSNDEHDKNEYKLYTFFIYRYNVKITQLLPSISLGKQQNASLRYLANKVSR